VTDSKSSDGQEKVLLTVTEDCLGSRLDVVLSRLLEEVPSRSFAQKLIEGGAVLVSGRVRRASWNLKEAELIEVDLSALRPPPTIPEAQKIPLKIVFEDEDILVIDKPAGMVVHPGAGVPDGTLVNAVLAHTGRTLPSLGDPLRAGLVHRLDRDTSGVMVVAKSQRALTELSRQFADHSQLRKYKALVFGQPSLPVMTLQTWHGRDPKDRLKYAVLPEGQGKLARMDVRTETVFWGGRVSLVICELFTGRTHQIRVQMSHLGHGLLGDALYFSQTRGKSAQSPLEKGFWAQIREASPRQMLHAHVLGLTHPVTHERLIFEVAPPVDFLHLQGLLASLS
jgi:23S rRNA pseudouridine1911/1915/1917 synthase